MSLAHETKSGETGTQTRWKRAHQLITLVIKHYPSENLIVKKEE